MSGQAVLLALASNICFAGLIASLYRPIWFRANGRVPSRWKIGGIWLALVVLCAALSLRAGFRSPSDADPTPSVEWTQVGPVTDVVVPLDSATVDAQATDIVRAIDEPMDAVKEAAEPAPVAPAPPPAKPARPSRPAQRAPVQPQR